MKQYVFSVRAATTPGPNCDGAKASLTQYYLGFGCMLGLETRRDFNKARISEQGNLLSPSFLGLIHEFGLGVPKSLTIVASVYDSATGKYQHEAEKIFQAILGALSHQNSSVK